MSLIESSAMSSPDRLAVSDTPPASGAPTTVNHFPNRDLSHTIEVSSVSPLNTTLDFHGGTSVPKPLLDPAMVRGDVAHIVERETYMSSMATLKMGVALVAQAGVELTKAGVAKAVDAVRGLKSSTDKVVLKMANGIDRGVENLVINAPLALADRIGEAVYNFLHPEDVAGSDMELVSEGAQSNAPGRFKPVKFVLGDEWDKRPQFQYTQQEARAEVQDQMLRAERLARQKVVLRATCMLAVSVTLAGVAVPLAPHVIAQLPEGIREPILDVFPFLEIGAVEAGGVQVQGGEVKHVVNVHYEADQVEVKGEVDDARFHPAVLDKTNDLVVDIEPVGADSTDAFPDGVTTHPDRPLWMANAFTVVKEGQLVLVGPQRIVDDFNNGALADALAQHGIQPQRAEVIDPSQAHWEGTSQNLWVGEDGVTGAGKHWHAEMRGEAVLKNSAGEVVATTHVNAWLRASGVDEEYQAVLKPVPQPPGPPPVNPPVPQPPGPEPS